MSRSHQEVPIYPIEPTTEEQTLRSQLLVTILLIPFAMAFTAAIVSSEEREYTATELLCLRIIEHVEGRGGDAGGGNGSLPRRYR